MDKQIIIDGVDVSNFYLVCYYDNKTNELVRVEQYNNNDSSMYSDIESYEYGYNVKIIKPEEIIQQFKTKEQECDMWKNLTIDNGAVALKYQQQLDQLKAENEELKSVRDSWISKYEQETKSKGFFEDRVRDLEFELKVTKADYEASEQELEQYKKSKQASYEQLQKKCNELELENRKFRELLITLDEEDKFEEIIELKQTLNEIKEILLKTPTDNKEHCVNSKSVILNKISEVIDE